jgi:hypothetical protein
MDLSRPPLVITFALSEKRKAIVADALSGASAVVYLTELAGGHDRPCRVRDLDSLPGLSSD